MKLNYKRTILVGFAFFIITAFWGAYDAIVPKILTNLFNMEQWASGIIMSLDNIFALFLLPFFGTLSDKASFKSGKRTPFIVVGTILAAFFFVGLGLVTSGELLVVFIILLLMTLVSMSIFRSPAVALMPDVTIKPLRSKGNAIINLMGTAGGIIVLILGLVFKTGEVGKTDFSAYSVAIGILMIAALIVFILFVKEPKWAKEMEEESKAYGIDKETEAVVGEKRKLTRPELVSLILILASVALWYTGYNAVTSKYSVYAEEVLKVDFNTTLIVAQAAAVISYIPVGMISSKIGRKKSILAGIVMLTAAFTVGIFLKEVKSEFYMFPIFALAGIGWATINVNSFPMAVELAKAGDVGKYTGYYYTASMAAQIITPVLSGVLVSLFDWWIFFPYAAVFAGLSFVTMMFVKHGDSKPTKQSALESLAGAED